ncbi:MAG: LuxR family transcriptional regulator [Chitinophagaceae bacterium]|nr:MAG: LuxR family transcriptional regulator [Chitinophagaceae bacterium]
MRTEKWLKHTNDIELEKAAHKAITQFREIEKHIPGVIIIHNLIDDSIAYLSERGREILNVTLEEIQLPHFDYHRRFFNPEDIQNYVPKVLGLLQRNEVSEMVTYFQQVRANEKEPWKWYSSSTKILLWDKDKRPVLAVTIAIPIDAEHHISPKIERLIKENTYLREKKALFTSLSKREKEVLRLLVQGHNSFEIAQLLNISEDTAKTHRKNIRGKLHAESSYDLLQFAQAFNIV